MTDSSCDPSPNTGATPMRASLKALRTARSHSPYTVGARAPVAQRGGVVQIALHQAHVAPAEGVRLRGVADEARHLVAARAQRLHEVRTDESRAAGDERLHSGLS